MGQRGEPHLAVRGGHFQLVSAANQFTALGSQLAFQPFPVIAGSLVIAIGQRRANINNRKPPLLRFFVPEMADLLAVEEFDSGIAHGSSELDVGRLALNALHLQ